MAAVVRLQALQGLKKLVPTVATQRNQVFRRIASTPHKNDTRSEAVSENTNKNWVSYGFDYQDQQEDENVAHSTFFVTITVCMVFGGFIVAYRPDPQLRDWSQREAFLELRRREEHGLPLIDPNLIDPAKITLPTDEELGDTDIII